MANKRWGTNDFDEATVLADTDQAGVVQTGPTLKYFRFSTFLKYLGLRGFGSGVTALTNTAGTVTIDLALGDYFTLTLAASVTSITFANLPAAGNGRTIALRITQDATGSRTLALPSSFKAVTGSDTAIQSAANARTLLIATSFDQGTRWEYSMKAIAA